MGDVAEVRALWTSYWEMLSLPLSFQGFGEQLKGLPGEFAAPSGLLLLAADGVQAAGTVAVRPLLERACEVKRLFVAEHFRGQGLGRDLLLVAIAEAKKMGYLRMYCDTLPSMREAAALYERMGFERTDAYSADPTPGALYFKLVLQDGAA